MAMEVPARKTKAGAQKWVIQRVKKSPGVVTARLVGALVRDQLSRKSRVWSSAMMTMTTPRAISMEAMRFIASEVTWGRGRFPKDCRRGGRCSTNGPIGATRDMERAEIQRGGPTPGGS